MKGYQSSTWEAALRQRSQLLAAKSPSYPHRTRKVKVNKSKTSMLRSLYLRKWQRNQVKTLVCRKKRIHMSREMLLHWLSTSTLKKCWTESSVRMSTFKNPSVKEMGDRIKEAKLCKQTLSQTVTWYQRDHLSQKIRIETCLWNRRSTNLIRKRERALTTKKIMRMISKT